jgi:hypothetical protein
VRKLKIIFPVVILMVSFASLVSVTGCKKTTNNIVQDSVYYSAWTNFNMKYDANASSGTDSVYDQTITAKSITQAVLDKGSVIVYITPGSGIYAEATSEGFEVILSVGQIYIDAHGAVPSTWQYRYVIIPGTVATQSQAKHLSYGDASKLYNFSN